MESMEFTKARSGLSGELTVPGDKSISHRAVMFGSIAKGLTEIRGFLQGADCLSTCLLYTSEQNPLLGAVGDHIVRPVQHGGRHKSQIAPADVEGIPRLHGLVI